jgi:hypothetical protein
MQDMTRVIARRCRIIPPSSYRSLKRRHARRADTAVCVALPQRAPPSPPRWATASPQREHGVKVDQSLRGRRGERLRNKVKSVFASSLDPELLK